MKEYRRFVAVIVFFLLLLIVGSNWWVWKINHKTQKAYKVDVLRAEKEILEKGFVNLDQSKYPHLIKITKEEDLDFLEKEIEDYCVLRCIDGSYYRFYYQVENGNRNELRILVNVIVMVVIFLCFGMLFYLKRQLLIPFQKMNHLPHELAKGNLVVPIKQEKSHYFGDFLWGMDLLREKLEAQKLEELKLQKEKKSFILSLTHDIKTPLSAIRLYSQALGRNLYKDKGKQQKVSESIQEKVDEIEAYLNKIISASREDFLHLDVQNGEFYIEDVKRNILSYYEEKLELLKIPFTTDWGSNCLLRGDFDRTVEVFQNLMENAIKYGDGSSIHIFSQEDEESRIIIVSNEGCSLLEEEMPHIFDSFWRGSNGKNKQGSGLGLYICREILKAMDGEIFAKCKNQRMEIFVVLRKA